MRGRAGGKGRRWGWAAAMRLQGGKVCVQRGRSGWKVKARSKRMGAGRAAQAPLARL